MFATHRILIFFFLICFSVSHAVAANLVKIAAPPSIWVREDGEKIKGPIIDFLAEVFAETGTKMTAEKLPWIRAVKNIETGDLDVIPVIFRTEEREKSMVFSVPYAEVPTVVFVAKGKNFPFLKVQDLTGRSGMIMRGDSISPEFEKYRANLDLTEVKDYWTILKMLESGRADYAVCAKYGFQVEARKYGSEERIESLPVPVALRSLHIAISKKSQFLEYLPKINNRIEDMQINGGMQALVEKTLSQAAENLHQ